VVEEVRETAVAAAVAWGGSGTDDSPHLLSHVTRTIFQMIHSGKRATLSVARPGAEMPTVTTTPCPYPDTVPAPAPLHVSVDNLALTPTLTPTPAPMPIWDAERIGDVGRHTGETVRSPSSSSHQCMHILTTPLSQVAEMFEATVDSMLVGLQGSQKGGSTARARAAVMLTGTPCTVPGQAPFRDLWGSV